MIRLLPLFVAMSILSFDFPATGMADSSNIPRPQPAAAQSRVKPQLERGFHLLYSLKFAEARNQFEDWQQTHPNDPLGYLGTAASYLFEEFHQQQVLTSKFFLDDERLLNGIEGNADEARKRSFEVACRKGNELAQKQLDQDPANGDALFALAIANGLLADYEGVIAKHQMKSLSLIRKAERYARQALERQPDYTDAWFSVGATNYIIGCLPAYKRFFLWFGGIHGDKDLGMQQLRIAAEKGHYLKPFAEIFLALAAMREKQNDLARSLLSDLAGQFPENPLYQKELSQLEGSYSGLKNGGH